MDNAIALAPSGEPAATERVQLRQRSPEWLEYRKSGIGASEAFIAVALRPLYKTTPVELALRKRGELPAPDLGGNLAVFLGSEMEAANRKWYAHETGREVQGYGYTLRRGALLADLDGLVVPDGAKTASFREEIRTDRIVEFKRCARWQQDGAGGFEIPVHYMMQAQAYMWLTGCGACDFSCFFKGQFEDWHRETVPADRELGEAIQRKVDEFWARYVVGGETPSVATEADCRLAWAASRARTTVATPDVADKIAQLLRIQDARAALDEQEAAARKAVMEYMGDAERLLAEDGAASLATWKSAKATRKTDWKAVAEELARTEAPEYVARIVAAHTEDKPGSRRFLLAK